MFAESWAKKKLFDLFDKIAAILINQLDYLSRTKGIFFFRISTHDKMALAQREPPKESSAEKLSISQDPKRNVDFVCKNLLAGGEFKILPNIFQ